MKEDLAKAIRDLAEAIQADDLEKARYWIGAALKDLSRIVDEPKKYN
jgi:hypothetical protein